MMVWRSVAIDFCSLVPGDSSTLDWAQTQLSMRQKCRYKASWRREGVIYK